MEFLSSSQISLLLEPLGLPQLEGHSPWLHLHGVFLLTLLGSCQSLFSRNGSVHADLLLYKQCKQQKIRPCKQTEPNKCLLSQCSAGVYTQGQGAENCTMAVTLQSTPQRSHIFTQAHTTLILALLSLGLRDEEMRQDGHLSHHWAKTYSQMPIFSKVFLI